VIAQLAADLANVQEYCHRSTRSLSDQDSGFAPAPEMFTAAQQVAHVAQMVEWIVEGTFGPGGFSTDWEAMDREVRAVESLAKARRWLERAFALGQEGIAVHGPEEWEAPLAPGAVMGGAPRFTILSAMRDHTAHHHGALTVYARLRGNVPPMPYAGD